MVSIRDTHLGRGLLAFVLFLSLAVAALGPALSTSGARAASPATIVLGSSTVVAGDTVKITGENFKPGEAIGVTLVSTGAVTSTTALHLIGASTTGGFIIPAQVIPASTPAGTYNVHAAGRSSGLSADAKLDVTSPKATLTASPTTLAPGDTVTVSGTGYLGGETVQVTITNATGSTVVPLDKVVAAADGKIGPKGLKVPFGVAAGPSFVRSTGLKSDRQASAVVTVKASTATVTVSPKSVVPGAKIAVSGSHFQSGETITIDIVALATSAHLATVQANSAGSFSVPAADVPNDTPQGTVTVVATGKSSHLSAATPLTVTAVVAGLKVTPSSVKAGNAVRVSGSHFIPGETITLQLSGGKLPAVTLGTAIANTAGAFTASVVVPAFIASGDYVLTAFGQTSGRSNKVGLTVTSSTTGPTLGVIDPSHIPGQPFHFSPGGLAVLAGSHYPAGAKVTIALVNGKGTITLLLVTASAAGAIGPIGVTIPANTPAGPYTLEALINGAKVAEAPVLVGTLTPHLSLSTGTLVPGHVVRVTGSGYAPGEQIVVSLNGAALVTVPATIQANNNGAFSATFVVPATVNNGANLVVATGATSRASASVHATASLPLATQWYFPHGDTSAGTQTQISILNPGSTLATIKMTFLYPNSPERSYSTTVAAHAQTTVGLNLVAGAGQHVSTILESDRQVSAESTIIYGGGDMTTAVGATGPSTLWYLAEGYTNGSFREFIEVMNPNTTFATIDVRFLPFNNRPAREVRFVLQPRSNIEIDAATYMPGQSISTIVTADKGVVVERSMRFGANGRGAHDKIGVTSASTVWLFAEGESSADSQTFFTILNPNQAAPAAVTATFFDRAGKPIGARTIVVDPLHRGNIKLNDVLPTAQVATILTSNVPVVVERPLYQGPANLGADRSGSVTFGRNGGGLSWAFPGASTANGDQSTLYLFNPGLSAAVINATFYTEAGAVVTQSYTLAPNSVTLASANSVTGLGSTAFGVVLKSTSQVFIAELGILNTATQHAASMQGVSQ